MCCMCTLNRLKLVLTTMTSSVNRVPISDQDGCGVLECLYKQLNKHPCTPTPSKMELQPMQIVIEGGDISGQAKKPKPGKEMAVQAVPVTESRFGAKNPKSPDGRRPSASPSLDAAPSSNKAKRPRLPLGLATEIRRRHRSSESCNHAWPALHIN